MKKFNLLLISFLLISTINLKAQDTTVITRHIDKGLIGFGLGLDYGGIGANFLYYATRNIGIFGGVGYNFDAVGVNAGIKFRLIKKKPTSNLDPYILAMYGYNAAIIVKNSNSQNKTFYGPTIGVGLDFRPKPLSMGYFSIALLIPIRKSEADDYISRLKKYNHVTFTNQLLPVAFSIGYRFIINYRVKKL
ncbi:MAG: hypothetical protein JEY97_11335 [Bacteroidales bacterium]|nr:hypothetical protein [Bacteroidales bacterium]